MSVIIINEGTVLAQAEWQARLSASKDEIKCLVEARVLRLADSGDYSLFFVGVVIFTDSLLFAQPKFGDFSPLDLPETLRILRNYFARSNQRRPNTDRNRDPEFGDSEILREFDALLGLKDWFFAHGVYRRQQTVSSNGGRPHWVRTIAKSPALCMQTSVVYPLLITERREGILNDVSALQIGVLHQLLQRYGLVIPGDILQAELATGTVIWNWPLEPEIRVYFQRCLAAEQRSVFRSDTLRLFKLLHELLDSRLAAPSTQPQIYGTTAFYSVWEDACHTGIAGDSAIGSNATLSQPTWWTYDYAGQKQLHRHRQIPDLIVQRGAWLLIIDAKYYYPFPSARPGAPDIIKQLYYAESMQHPKNEILSIFLLPLPGATIPRFLGYAMIDGVHRSLNPIEAWGIDPVTLLSAYPAMLTGSANSIVDTIVNHRTCVSKFISQAPMDIRS